MLTTKLNAYITFTEAFKYFTNVCSIYPHGNLFLVATLLRGRSCRTSRPIIHSHKKVSFVTLIVKMAFTVELSFVCNMMFITKCG